CARSTAPTPRRWPWLRSRCATRAPRSSAVAAATRPTIWPRSPRGSPADRSPRDRPSDRIVELDDRQEVPVRILEPRGAAGTDRRDPVDRCRALVGLELDPA